MLINGQHESQREARLPCLPASEGTGSLQVPRLRELGPRVCCWLGHMWSDHASFRQTDKHIWACTDRPPCGLGALSQKSTSFKPPWP